MTLVFCPMFERVEDAIDWFARRGYDTPNLWSGPDGSIRGSAPLRTSFGVCSKRLHALTPENTYREPRRCVIHCVMCRRDRTRARLTWSCGKCGKKGHNRRSCK